MYAVLNRFHILCISFLHYIQSAEVLSWLAKLGEYLDILNGKGYTLKVKLYRRDKIMKMADYTTAIGILAGVMGLLLLFAPGVLKKINEMSQRMIARIDTATFTYRIGFGVSLLIAALFLVFMGYYFKVKGR